MSSAGNHVILSVGPRADPWLLVAKRPTSYGLETKTTWNRGGRTVSNFES